MKYKEYTAEKDYINYEDLIKKLGYRTYQPKIGSLGKALITATKKGNHRSIGWLKHQLDILFQKKRRFNTQDRNNSNNGSKKQNS